MPDPTIRALVRGTYDLQRLRIEHGNRLVANFRAKLGLEPGEKPEETPRVLLDLETRFKRITDGVVEVTRRRKYDFDGVISDYTELCLVYQYVDLAERERKHFRQMATIIEAHPLWPAFLKDVKGCGPAMSGVLLSEIDITKARYASSLWKYAGLDVANGSGRSRRAEHLVDRRYTAADGTEKTRKSITFNPFLKTKLMGVLSGSILRAGESPYRTVYDDYKHRLENRPDLTDESKGHRHNMALRYMIKRFLADLYVAWRTLEGLPVEPPYHEAKLGLKHSKA